jgi:hypothetical protein
MYRRYQHAESLSPSTKQLFNAVENGDAEGVRLALSTVPQRERDALCCYLEGDLAIHVAATRGHRSASAHSMPAARAGEEMDRVPEPEHPCNGCLIIRLLAAHEPACLKAGSGIGFSALHVAVTSGPLCAVGTLIAAGSDVLARKEYHAHGSGPARSETFATPLHLAARISRLEAVSLIVASSPESVLAVDRKGWTPLHYTASFGRGHEATSTAKALLAAGADPCIASVDGTTPRSLAVARCALEAQDQELAELCRVLGVLRDTGL